MKQTEESLADAVFGALYCRGSGAVTKESLKGIYLAKNRLLGAPQTVTFGEEEDGGALRW